MGFYLINKAQNEIREMNQQVLFQKAKIKKNYMEKTYEKSLKLKKSFIETYDLSLNDSLSSNLLNLKEFFLDLKHKIINEFNNDLQNRIKENIKKNYSKYINFLLKNIKNISRNADLSSKIVILFNSRDYNYFSKNSDKIKNLFKNEVLIKKSKNNFIGGFELVKVKGDISYNYTIDNLIDKNSNFIQAEISKIIDDTEIKKIEGEFEAFFKDQKLGIEGYLKEYDQI